MSDLTLLKLGCFVASGVWVALILVLSVKYPYRKDRKILRKWFWDDLIMYTIVQSVVLGQAIGWLIKFIDNSTNLSRLRLVSDWPIWLQLIFFIVLHDLFIYFFHMAMHKNAFLWRFHEAHHSIEDVDWVGGSRSHPFEIMINQTVEFGMIVLLGGAPAVAVLKAFVSSTWGIWIHNNINVRAGWLQYVINGPEMHRWHHHPEHDHSNYATKLAIWDWLFRTAFYPKDRVADRYGLDDPSYPGGYFRQMLAFFRSQKPAQERSRQPNAG
ncbi:MAG: sterol desaturase family protein [Deltaproteobacteria bacterium]|nr:sterol desaturase family protein [Deltaproteobacteria bacterium]